MDLAEYQTLTGITVATNRVAVVTAQITRTQKILESMLGFTLDVDEVKNNEYTEIGKTKAVVCAYRMFDYNRNDKYFYIDPATRINKIKLVVDGVTVKTLDEFEDYRLEYKQGLIKYIERIINWCSDYFNCDHVQLAVDAEWVWQNEDDIPDELNYIWADIITFYSDPKNNIKSETLGPHSYTKFDNLKPEFQSQNLPVIKKYSGPHGSINKLITI